MTGWQMAMQMYHVAPTPLAQRVPMNDTTGRKVEPLQRRADRVRIEHVEQWEAMKRKGFSTTQIAAAAAADRTERTIRRYLSRESVAHD